MNNDFLYSFLSFVFSGLLFIENKRFVTRKKKNNALDGYDRTAAIPKNWILIVFLPFWGFIF